MEVSSIALAAQRVEGIRFRVAAFTNLTQDHLDYHGSMKAYAAAKDRLFVEHRPAVAVINVDDPHGRTLAERVSASGACRVVRFSEQDPRAEVSCRDVTLGSRGIEMRLSAASTTEVLRAPLVGAHNVSNLLCMAAIIEGLELDLSSALGALDSVPAVAGRLERCDVPGQDDLVVLVDYAHTPDALERVLGSVRSFTDGRVWCVFGCGGDRDRAKRRPMGAAVARAADVAILTNDNPRGEDPVQIADAVIEGLEQGNARYDVELDRGRAIERAVGQAEPGDVVLVAGKGHEPYQIIGATTESFDDRLEVRRALEQRRGAKRTAQ
jgi:UDP-N-acetylmuramoyl-L-alanyl-D-glutamate--2,6-diaminopimelate ligase